MVALVSTPPPPTARPSEAATTFTVAQTLPAPGRYGGISAEQDPRLRADVEHIMGLLEQTLGMSPKKRPLLKNIHEFKTQESFASYVQAVNASGVLGQPFEGDPRLVAGIAFVNARQIVLNAPTLDKAGRSLTIADELIQLYADNRGMRTLIRYWDTHRFLNGVRTYPTALLEGIINHLVGYVAPTRSNVYPEERKLAADLASKLGGTGTPAPGLPLQPGDRVLLDAIRGDEKALSRIANALGVPKNRR